jgi:hippurate hydrolase
MGEALDATPSTSGCPGFMFQLGVVDTKRWEASRKPGGEPLPTVHSSKFQVDIEPTLQTGVRCMTSLALSLLSEP